MGTGLESNPPAFHLLTRMTERVFGEGLIATRLPEIVAFWVMCLCLFKYVERRAGAVAGVIAMTLPMLSGAYYYAYEARPLIIVVACGAAALLCWDNSLRFPHQRRWLVCFSAVLFAAFMLHCYAILLIFPFGAAGIARDVRHRAVSWPFWVALAVPILPACLLYIPLLHAFSAFSKGTDFAAAFPAVWPEVLRFYVFLLLPCSAILFIAFTLFALDRVDHSGAWSNGDRPYCRFNWDDAVLCLSFGALPALGVVLAQLVHSPYFGRYFLSALLGLCVPLAINAGAARSRKWLAPLLAAVIICGLGLNLFRIVRHRLHGEGEALREPSTGKLLPTTPSRPLLLYPLIQSVAKDSKPIAVLEPLDFLYLLKYAPKLTSRLYYVHSFEADASLRGLRAFRQWSPVKYNPVYVGSEFVKLHPDFYIYSDLGHTEDFYRFSRLASIKSFKAIESHFLATMKVLGH